MIDAYFFNIKEICSELFETVRLCEAGAAQFRIISLIKELKDRGVL